MVVLAGTVPGGNHDDGVGAGWDVEVASVDAEADVGNERRDGSELLAGGNEIDVYSTGMRVA